MAENHEIFVKYLLTLHRLQEKLRCPSSQKRILPIFLHRTLSYLKNKTIESTSNNTKSKRRRRDIKCEEFLSKREQQEKNQSSKENGTAQEEIPPCSNQSNLELRFMGFFHGPNLTNELAQNIDNKIQIHLVDEFVDVNVSLMRIYHKRRKDESLPMDSVPLGSCKATCNPRTELFNNGPTFTINIPYDAFDESARGVKTFILSVQLNLHARKELIGRRTRRKRKTSVLNGVENEATGETEHDHSNVTDSEQQNSSSEDSDKIKVSYTAEMIVFDKYKVPLLLDGDYELLLQRSDVDNIEEKENWEGDFSEELGAFNLISFGPTIKFHLEWSKQPPSKTTLSQQEVVHLKNIDSPKKKINPLSTKPSSQQIQRIFYQFIYSNNTKQQTEAREDFYCPWCLLNCQRLYPLLKHLRLSHPRFSFIYTPVNRGARIDVGLNENFEWQSSSKHRSLGSPQIALMRGEGPIKHTCATQLLVTKMLIIVSTQDALFNNTLFYTKAITISFQYAAGKRRDFIRAPMITENLSEFLEPEYFDSEGLGKNCDRVYYHANSTMPLYPGELEYNSEDEKAPDWIKDKTKSMIEDFTDVNPGEKELTAMWNIHILTEGCIADFQMTNACQLFVTKYGEEINKKGLQRNFLLHLCNLADFGLLPLNNIESLTKSLENVQSK